MPPETGQAAPPAAKSEDKSAKAKPGPPKRHRLEEVILQEHLYLAERRARAHAALPEPDRSHPARRLDGGHGPIGLAFSGGGIRSATFNLGVLQSLAERGILPRVDYLSTVSGGGYIGSCLSSLLSRRQPEAFPTGKPRTLKEEKAPYLIGSGADAAAAFGTRPENFPFNVESNRRADTLGLDGAEQVRHLRTHGDFIIARKQVLSRDMLRAVGSVLGGLFYHLFIFVLFMLFASGVYFSCVCAMIGDLRDYFPWPPIGFKAYVLSLLDGGRLSDASMHPIIGAFVAGLVMTLVSVGITRLRQIKLTDDDFREDGLSPDDVRDNRALKFQIAFTLLTAVLVTWYYVDSAVALGGREPVLLMIPLGVYFGGQLGALLLHAYVAIRPRYGRNDRSRFAAIKGILNYLTAVSLLVVLLPWLIYRLADPDWSASLSLGWLLSAAGSAFLMRGGAAGKAASTAGGWMKRLLGAQASIRNVVLAVLVVILLVGGVVLISSLVVLASKWLTMTPLEVSGWLTLFAGAVFALMGYVLDFNNLSLHYFYRDRLVETYLQTFAPRSNSHDSRPEIRLRDDGEMPLTHLHGHPAGKDAAERCVTDSPLHLIVASLNLTGSRDMTRRDRKSDHFTFSKLHCGSETTGYMKTGEYRNGQTKLARAMTISGAAASPAMGRETFFAEAFALTLFNARLGQWMENPRYNRGSHASRNENWIFWPFYLICEMIGYTDARSRLIHLSDGGHTGDNIGIVPLLKRRCSLIVACDAEADPKYVFGSLSEGLRQAYVDDNIKVDLSLDEVEPDPDTGLSAKHVAVGRITYPPVRWKDAQGNAVDIGKEQGWLVVLKSSLCGQEKAKIGNYKRENPVFPQQTTADQFFDDSQFESYRELGYHVAETSLPKDSEPAWRPGTEEFDAFWNAQQ